MLPYFEKISPLVESLWCAVQYEVHIMGYRAAGGCEVIQDGKHLGAILDFTKN